MGGHYIPLKPYYLSWKAWDYGFRIKVIESSMTINDSRPRYCIFFALL